MSSKLDLEKFRKLLIDERERLALERTSLHEDNEARPREAADYDSHPADAASDTFERTRDYALEEHYKGVIERIDAALQRIDDKTYGVCDRCGEPINPERLRAIPYATMCIRCQEFVEES